MGLLARHQTGRVMAEQGSDNAQPTHSRARPQTSLARRFALFTTLIIILVSTVFALAHILSDRSARLAAIESATASLTAALAATVGADVAFNEKRRVATLVNAFAEHHHIDHLAVYTAGTGTEPMRAIAVHGEAVEASVRAALTRARSLPGGLPANGRVELGSDGCLTLVPITHVGNVVGYAVAWQGSSAVTAGLLEAVLKACILAALLIAVAVPLSFSAAGQVTQPLRTLTEFAKKVSARDLSSTLDLQTGDELEDLARAFNTMVKRLEASMSRVNRLAYVDPITDLPNRERFSRDVEAALARMPNRLALVGVLDVKRFRWINETLGPQLGDQVLGAVAQRLSAALSAAERSVRPLDVAETPGTLARIGSNEFAVLLPGLRDPSEGARILQLVAAGLRQPISVGGHNINIAVAVGAAFGPRDGHKAAELLKHADLALKAAKREPEGKARFFTRQMNRTAMERLQLESDLRAGLDRGEIFAYFQPKIDLATNQLVGVEALARWRRGDRIVSPGVFIELAEEIGLIDRIGEAVLEDACKAAANWRRHGLICKMAVNVSPKQFERGGLSDKILETLRRTSLPPGQLELEITESMAVSDPQRVSDIMRPLRQLGVRLAIDDFGAGHSNLVTLTKLPFDVFKIDQQFVRALHEDGSAPAIVEMILAMASAMHLETVAEGVETMAQADFLRRRGCTLGQGYLFSPPVSADELLKFALDWAARQNGPDWRAA